MGSSLGRITGNEFWVPASLSSPIPATGTTSGMGQKAKYSLRADVFRFTPESGLKSDITACPKSAVANCGHWHGTYGLVFLAPADQVTNA